MILVAEAYIKKDSRNRITLPADVKYAHFHMKQYDDGRIELLPQLLVDAAISPNALREMDEAITNFHEGRTGEALDLGALEELADQSE